MIQIFVLFNGHFLNMRTEVIVWENDNLTTVKDLNKKVPRPNEFVSMTARKDDTSPVKSIFYDKRPCKTI